MAARQLSRVLGTVLAAAVLAGAAQAGGTRGVTVKLRADERADSPIVDEVRLYDASHALVIGIDAYTGGWPRLSNAVDDATRIAAELRKRGFDVTLETNLGSADLKRTLEEFFVIRGEKPNARLFVWFAGHGHTAKGEGFLVPADAPRPEAGARFRLKALSLRRFGEFVRLAQAKHAFTVFDACFAGTVFDTGRSLPPAAITRATTLPVRQFLTSGDAAQQVSDDGTFRKLFLRALRGEEKADANADGYLTASEFGQFLSDRMTNLTSGRQSPRHGKLRDADYDRGDFVFVLPGAPPAPASGGGGAAEVAFWNSIEGGTDARAFEAYLSQFPSGTFAPLARLRLEELRKPVVAPPLPEPVAGRYVATTTANVRAKPGTASRKVGRLPQGTHVEVIGREQAGGATWYRVRTAGREAALSFSMGGRVEQVLAAPGESVGKGQILARLYSAAAEVGLEEAMLALAASEAEVAQLRKEAAGLKKLYNADLVTRLEVDRMAARLAAARRNQDGAKGRVALARRALGDIELVSPVDGVLDEIRADVGFYVRAGEPALVVRRPGISGYVYGPLLERVGRPPDQTGWMPPPPPPPRGVFPVRFPPPRPLTALRNVHILDGNWRPDPRRGFPRPKLEKRR